VAGQGEEADGNGNGNGAEPDQPAADSVRVVSAHTVMPLWTGEQGGEARLMLTTSGAAPVEVWWRQLRPGEEYPSHPHQAGAVETVSVTPAG
jgi:hypothetical protein